MSTHPPPRWPLPAEVEAVLDGVAALIARRGPWPVLAGHVVQAGARDLPDPWSPTRSGVARIVERLRWHARLELAAPVEDGRTAAPPSPARVTLRTTRLAPTAAGALRLDEIGEPLDAAAAAALGLGALVAGAAQGPGEGPGEGAALASGLAGAAYLGLGVVAAAAPPPGLAPDLIAAVVAAVAAARGAATDAAGDAGAPGEPGAPGDALAAAAGSLAAEPASQLAAWRRALAPHREALRVRLGLVGAAPGEAPPRAPAPPPIPDDPDEAARLRPFNAGREVHRVRHHHGATVAACCGVAGCAATLLLGPAGLAAVPLGALAGWLVGSRLRSFVCDDPRCEWPLPPDATTCPRCGGRVSGEVAFDAARR